MKQQAVNLDPPEQIVIFNPLYQGTSGYAFADLAKVVGQASGNPSKDSQFT